MRRAMRLPCRRVARKEANVLEGVIFDMDGLLFDTEPVWGAMWVPVLERHGIHETRGIEDKVRGTAGAAMAAIVRETFGPEVDAESIVADEFASVEREILVHPPAAKPGVEEITSYLAEQGIPMAIASSSVEELICSNIRAAGIAERFSVLLSSGSAGIKRGKPAPDVFLAAAERLGVDPAHTLVLEDAPNGVRAGHAGGFITVMVPDLIAPTPELLELTDACCTNLLEVRDLIAAGKLG